MMMKLTFEGKTLGDILDEMQGMLEKFKPGVLTAAAPEPVVPKAIDHEAIVQEAKAYMEAPFIVDKPVAKPVEKRVRTEKQLANDEKMRVAALARVAARRDAKARNTADVDPVKEPAPTPFDLPPEPEIDPVEMVKLREKTFEELRTAYANGHQNEVMELLSRFGNGAKTFRELPPESFVPIRKAIDLGALE